MSIPTLIKMALSAACLISAAVVSPVSALSVEVPITPANTFIPRTATIPDLNWTPRSDWTSVKDHGAKGDGQADDTAAIQAAINTLQNGSTLYFPRGIYRITKTLTPAVNSRLLGVTLLGHGRTSILQWDGEAGGSLFWQNVGWPLSGYVGLTFDGRNKAAVGLDIGCMNAFETEMRFQHDAFLNFTDSGIRLGAKMKLATAETLYENCLFENCGHGISIINFNYLDHTFVGCEFRKCKVGIYAWKGSNFYARDCRFEQNSEADVVFRGESGSSLRRCTSQGSKQFVTFGASVAPLVIQDCRIDGWLNLDGAVTLGGAPVLLFDTVFSRPPNEAAPVVCTAKAQRLILSNNKAEGRPSVVSSNGMGQLYEIPSGALGGVLKSPAQFFLRSEVKVPEKVFDVKLDFGAKGDGKTDDTAALQKAIDAARTNGNGALAYLPKGVYAVSNTIRLTGGGYRVGGSGFGSAVIWKGAVGGATLQVSDPDRLILENLVVGRHDYAQGVNDVDILQTGSDSGKPTAMLYDRVWVFGMYQKQPLVRGFRAVNLGSKDRIYFREFNGNIHVTDSADATIYLGTTYEGSVVVEGKSLKRGGFLGGSVRLGTITDPGLWVKDNHSIVMSDLYVESSQQYGRLEGDAKLPAGRVTIQGAKFEIVPDSTNNAVDISNYKGEFLVGPYQYYVGNPLHKFVQRGPAPFSLLLWGSCFYQSRPDLKLAPNATADALGNCTVGGNGEGEHAAGKNAPGVVDTATKDAATLLSKALDDLRRLGQVDLELAHSVF